MRILISGSSGFVGTELIKYLELHGHEVFRLVRNKNKLSDHAIFFDPASSALPSNLEPFEKMDAVINLSGENIADGRWSEEKKKRILDSRVSTTKALCNILKVVKNPPKVLVNASAIGFYGDRGDEELTEDSLPGTNFLSQVCKAWESETESLKATGIRVVLLRFGAVLSPEGGALAKMLLPFKLCLGGNLGSGDQYFSFIALDDLTRVILFAVETDSLNGPVNAVTPHPIQNKAYTKALGNVLKRPTIFPVPAFAARLAFGQMADELLLASQKVYPKKLLAAAFKFDYPTIQDTLKHYL